MNKKNNSRESSAKKSARIATFLKSIALLATLLLAFATPARAAIIVIDLGPSGFDVLGPNGGVSAGSAKFLSNFPFAGAGSLALYNNYSLDGNGYGLDGSGLFYLAYLGPIASPKNFSAGQSIDGTSQYSGAASDTTFSYVGIDSPNFGAGSYMGFRTATGNYGWLETTWNSSTKTFQILSGAYESVALTPILAGAGGPAAVPEPGTWAAAALLVGGAAFVRWRRRKN